MFYEFFNFRVDDMSLTDLWRSKKRNIVTFYEWVGSAKVPALPSVLRLYKHLIDKKVKIVFLTGSSDAYTKAREDNLKSVGYTTWDKLILRSKDDYDKGLRGAIFKLAKRKELEEKDPKHRIIGNMGDQWSDLIGTNVLKGGVVASSSSSVPFISLSSLDDRASRLISCSTISSSIISSYHVLPLVDTWHQELFSAQTNFLVQRAKLWNSHVYYVASGMSKKISLDQIIKRMLRVHLV
ncbi:hypothetical protein LguiA_019516 [Lonicera macranthoides]